MSGRMSPTDADGGGVEPPPPAGTSTLAPQEFPLPLPVDNNNNSNNNNNRDDNDDDDNAPTIQQTQQSEQKSETQPSEPQIDLFAMQQHNNDTKKMPAPAPAPTVSIGRTAAKNGAAADDIICGTVVVPGPDMQPSADGRRGQRASHAAAAEWNAGANAGTHTLYMGSAHERAGAGGGPSSFGFVEPMDEEEGGGQGSQQRQNQEQHMEEWEWLQETTQLSQKMRLLWLAEFIIAIITSVSFPYFLLAMPFVFVGFVGARWFKPNVIGAALLWFIAIPLEIAAVAVRAGQSTMDDFDKGIMVTIMIVTVFYHGYVVHQNYQLYQRISHASTERIRQLLEMPPICGCA